MKLFGQLPDSDLLKLAELSEKSVFEIKDTNVIIVGANGFIGKWLSTYFSNMINQGLKRGTLTLVTRDLISKEILQEDFPSSSLVNICSNEITKDSFHHLLDQRTIVIFAATSTSDSGILNNTLKSQGLELAKKVMSNLPTKDNLFVHLSSGGIYEQSARSLVEIPKEYEIQKKSNDLYTHEKITLEEWSLLESAEGKFVAKNPRLFSFYGPGLPLDRHFVISQFLSLALGNKSILISGNPSNLRSYLHPVDLVLQILGQCLRADPGFSQIGSYKSISILELANLVGDMFKVGVEVDENHSLAINNYVPSDVPKIEHKSLNRGIEQWNEWLQARVT